MKRLLGILVISLLVMPCIANALDIKDEELLLYLPLDKKDGNTARDYSPHGKDGEIVGPIDLVEGKYEKAFKFSENAEVKCPHIPLNDRSFTVCLWVNPALTGGGEQCVFTQMQVNGTNTSMHYRIYGAGNVRMGFYSNDLDSAGAVTADEWAHLCFWCDADSNTRKIYVNGEEKANDAGKPLYKGTAGDTVIGSWSTSGQKFNGIIDEVQVWDRALSEKEIKESMDYLMEDRAVDTAGKLATTWGSLKS